MAATTLGFINWIGCSEFSVILGRGDRGTGPVNRLFRPHFAAEHGLCSVWTVFCWVLGIATVMTRSVWIRLAWSCEVWKRSRSYNSHIIIYQLKSTLRADFRVNRGRSAHGRHLPASCVDTEPVKAAHCWQRGSILGLSVLEQLGLVWAGRVVLVMRVDWVKRNETPQESLFAVSRVSTPMRQRRTWKPRRLSTKTKLHSSR